MARKIAPKASKAKRITKSYSDDIVVNHRGRNSHTPRPLKALPNGFVRPTNVKGKRNNKARPMVLSRQFGK